MTKEFLHVRIQGAAGERGAGAVHPPGCTAQYRRPARRGGADPRPLVIAELQGSLSATGNRGVTRSYPHTPGIDAAGVVAASAVPELVPGDEVIVTGYDLGMNTPGGFGQYIRVPAGWVLKRPAGLSLRESMVLGTAGLTAGLCIDKLERAGLTAGAGPVLVTGATGGVGSIAVAMLRSEEIGR